MSNSCIHACKTIVQMCEEARAMGKKHLRINKIENLADQAVQEDLSEERNKRSNWHTGTPTEDGLYAVYYLNDNNPTGEEYETLCDVFVSPVFNDGCVERWVNDNRGLVFDADEIVRWQKIEPYKEKEDGADN